MEKRFEGFLAPNGLFVLDTHSGEVRFVANPGGSQVESAAAVALPSAPTLSAPTASAVPGAAPASGHSPFESEVIASYPYLIAKPFSDLLKEKDARLKCKLMVDTFTAVLKYLALQLASEYLRAVDVRDVQVHQTLTKDLSRPLISAWNLLIARCLPVLKDNKIPLFSPEIKEAYEKLESKCKEPFLVSQTYSDENGELKTKTKKLGKIQALINYRNGLAHGFNQSQARAQKEFDEYYPLLCDILQEVRFVSRYTLWHVESSRKGVNGIRLMGASPSMKKVDFDRDGVDPAVSPLFLINDATGDILPLYAFFDVDESGESGLPEVGKDVFVFEGNTKNTVIYLSSTGEHLEKTSRFQHWKDLLAQKQLEVEGVDAKNLSAEVLHAIGTHISTAGIQALIASGKYLREATIARKDLDDLLDSFSYSSFNGFVLGGESGIGKSTLLAQKTEQWQAGGHMVAFYRGSALNQSDIAAKFLRDCAVKVGYLEDFLSLAHSVFSGNGKKCYLVLDALNEYAGDLNELIRSVENTVAQAAPYPWFKLVVSIRDSAYNRATARFGELAAPQYFTVEEDREGNKVKTNIIRLQPVAKDFVEQLYNAYREFKWRDNATDDTEGYYKFRPLTTFAELDPEGSTVQLIRSPLMARLVMQSFHRAKLPAQLKNDEAMRLYQDNIVIEKTDDAPGFPERKKLLTLLVAELDKHMTERMDRDELMKIPALRTYLVNTQKDSAYLQLLELGVLMEEWEGENCYVRFAFDKFLEFLLAEMHWPRVNDAAGLMELCRRAATFRILQGAIETIVMRFCLNGQSGHLVELIDLTDSADNTLKALVADLVERILFLMSTEHYSLFKEVISLLPEAPGETDLMILRQLLAKLFLTGHLTAYSAAMEVAVKEAELLGNKKVLSDLIQSQAEFDGMQGRIDDALSKLDQAIVLKKEIKDEVGMSHCMRLKGVRYYSKGRVLEAEKLFQESLELCRHLSDKKGVSLCLNNLGVLNSNLGRMVQAESLYKEALLMHKELADKKGTSLILSNLGILYKNQGRLVEAEKLYEESLLLRKDLGDKHGIAVSLNNLGLLIKDQGRIIEAERIFLESLEIRRMLGDRNGISSSLNNLGSLFKDQGRMEEAEKFYLESLQIRRELGDKQSVGESLNNLGILHKNQGRMEAAETMMVESLEIYKELGDKKGVSSSMNSLGTLYKDLGRVSEAELLYLESLEIKRELNDKQGLSTTLTSLGLLYNDQGRMADAEKLYLEAIEITRGLGNKEGLSRALRYLGAIYYTQGRRVDAENLYLESLQLSKELGDKSSVADSLNSLGILYLNQGRIAEAEGFYLESLKIKEELGDKKGIGLSLNNLGWLYKSLGRSSEAEKLYHQALLIYQDLGDKKGISTSFTNLGILYRDLGRLDDAEKLFQDASEIYEELGDQSGLSKTFNNLASLFRNQGRLVEAEQLYLKAMIIYKALDDKSGITGGLNNLGLVYINQGRHLDAEKLYMESLMLRRELRDKQGVSVCLNNLGFLAAEQCDDLRAKGYFEESIPIIRELKQKVRLVLAIHRAFYLFDSKERMVLFEEVMQLETADFASREKYWLADIRLMQSCLERTQLETEYVLNAANEIITLVAESKMYDIFDLPIETFFIAANRLVELGDPRGAAGLARQALSWIGERKTRRKSALETLAQAVPAEG